MELETQLLPESRAEPSVRTRRTVIGDDLRSVTYFTYSRCEQIYLRNDLETGADLTGFVGHEINGFQIRTAYHGSELGDYRYTIRAFNHGYLTRVTADDKGMFITTDGLMPKCPGESASTLDELLRE